MTTTIEPVRTGPRQTLWLLRGTVTLGTVGVLLQPILAGGYLSGEFDFLDYHGTNATIVQSLLILQAVAALLYWLPGRGSALPLAFTAVQFLATGLQIGMGYGRTLAVHIPLGVLLTVMSLLVCGWVYRPSARMPRHERGSR